ncbi:unnamed protein product, partial [Polarella glacialis]
IGKRPGWTAEDRQKVRERFAEAKTGLGLPDMVFDAAMLVQDTFDLIRPTSPPLQQMMEPLLAAAQIMGENAWLQFQEMPFKRIHADDQAVHGNFFAKIEPTWKTTLQQAKKASSSFLHIGTTAPTSYLCGFLTKQGWVGAVVCPQLLPEGSDACLEHVCLNPALSRDQKALDGLISASGGLIAKPFQFQLAFVNVTFNQAADTAYEDPFSDEEGDAAQDSEPKEVKPEAADPNAYDPLSELRYENFDDAVPPVVQQAPSKPPILPDKETTQKSKQELSQEAREAVDRLNGMPATARGYGRMGTTRGERVRGRLRALRNSLLVAIHRLATGGSLVMLWPGLPLHPVLFFIAAYLRKVFLRVHVVTPEGCKSFEIYILAVGFKRDVAQSSVPGSGGLELRSFLENSFRTEALDDVLLWTLSAAEELDEAEQGAGGNSIMVGYDKLWKDFGIKYRALALDLGVVISLPDDKIKRPLGTPKKAAASAAAPAKVAKTSVKEPKQSQAESTKDKGQEADATKSVAAAPAAVAAAPSVAAAEPAAAAAAPSSAAVPPAPPEPAAASPQPKTDQAATVSPPQEPSAEKADAGLPPKADKTVAASLEKAVPKLEKASEEKQEKETAKPASNDKETTAAKTTTTTITTTTAATTTADVQGAEQKPAGAEDQGEATGKRTESKVKVAASGGLKPVSPKKKRYQITDPVIIANRGLGSLASTLGASPGHKLRAGPNIDLMAEEFKLMTHAIKVAQSGAQPAWIPRRKVLPGVKLPPQAAAGAAKEAMFRRTA